jgi:hypothetical protein
LGLLDAPPQFPSLAPVGVVPQVLGLPPTFLHGTTVQLFPLAVWHGPEFAAGDLQVPDWQGVFVLHSTPVLTLPLKQNPTVVVSWQSEMSPLLKASIAVMQSIVPPWPSGAVTSPPAHAASQAAKTGPILRPEQSDEPLALVTVQFRAAAINCLASCFVDVPCTGTQMPSIAELALLAVIEFIFSPQTDML